MQLSSDQLDYVRKFVRSRAAIVLDEKDYLIQSRLHTLAGQQGFSNAGSLIEAARRQPAGRALELKILDALTTNETYFFRDPAVYDSLRDSILPSVRERNAASRTLRIWSGACATGQEPYSIAMLLYVHFPELDSWNVEILATDISDSALERAEMGRYSQAEIHRGLPASMMRFFEKRGQWWHVDARIRRMVQFSRQNLIEPWPAAPPFDLILVRNVMIYFDTATRVALLERIADRLAVGGYFLMGAAESPIGLSGAFTAVGAGKGAIFQKA